MKITILGCGTSTGVPIPGCDCPVCKSLNPKNNRTRTSALITTNTNHQILIDASIDLRIQALRQQINHLDAVLYTHPHMDHILGTDDLRCFNFHNKTPINCFASVKTIKELERIFPYVFNPNPDYEGGLVAQLNMTAIEPFDSFSVSGVEILPLLLWHGKTECLGYRIGRLAYLTDCKTIPEESLDCLKGVDTLILDGLRHEQHKTHLTIAEAINYSRQIGAGNTYLTHMTHTIDYVEDSKKLPKGVFLAYDGLELEFD